MLGVRDDGSRRIGKIAKTEAPMLRVLGETVRRELREFVVVAGMSALATVLEQGRTEACGPRYEHRSDRRARSQATHQSSW